MVPPEQPLAVSVTCVLAPLTMLEGLALRVGAEGAVQLCAKYCAPSGSVPAVYPEGVVIPEGLVRPPHVVPPPAKQAESTGPLVQVISVRFAKFAPLGKCLSVEEPGTAVTMIHAVLPFTVYWRA